MEDSFALLEEKVGKAADLVKRLRKENRSMGEEMARMKSGMQEAEKKIAALQKQTEGAAQSGQAMDGLRKELDALKSERTEVKNRIGKLVELLEGLE